MSELYLECLEMAKDEAEIRFIQSQKRTCYNGIYPFKIFPDKGLETVSFAPITVFYGGNGSGKTTLLNVIAEKTGVIRHSPFNNSAFFADYIHLCRITGAEIPEGSQILTSDDVFDYALDLRCLNDGIDRKREDLFQEYLDRKYTSHRLQSMEEFDDWKESLDAKRKTQSKFVRERLMRSVEMFSNGESAMKYFVSHIGENALYLLDEPENSLSIAFQQELADFISDSARYFGCQFILATHSPVLLAMKNARIYDLDAVPVTVKPWTELENVRRFHDFFESHRAEFLRP